MHNMIQEDVSYLPLALFEMLHSLSVDFIYFWPPVESALLGRRHTSGSCV